MPRLATRRPNHHHHPIVEKTRRRVARLVGRPAARVACKAAKTSAARAKSRPRSCRVLARLASVQVIFTSLCTPINRNNQGHRLALLSGGKASVARMERSAIRVSRTQHNSPGFRFASSGLRLRTEPLLPVPRRKFLLDILPPIQHTHDFRRVIDDTIEDDVRSGGKRTQAWAHLVSRASRKRMVFNQRNHFSDFAEYFSAVCLPATRA